MKKSILISQDLSCVGQVSMGVALPILGALGFNPSVLPTALLSTHTGGFGKNTYLDLSAEIGKIISHWQTLPITFSAIYLGYLGVKPLSTIITEIDKIATNSFLLLDPVMGDHGKLYSGFDSTYVDNMKILAKKANLITPNITEVQLLLDLPCFQGPFSSDAVLTLINSLHNKYPNTKIILTGIPKTNNTIGIAGFDNISQEIWQLETPRIGSNFFGTGDIFASVLLGSLLHGQALKDAATTSMDFISNTIKKNIKIPGRDSRFGLDYSLQLPVLLKQLNLGG
ncbi:pyridoxamine kinase [Liquorilactobacillus cacaonum]|nr:pyridoxamine kinase [Liquorilactobacillus cacaonum]